METRGQRRPPVTGRPAPPQLAVLTWTVVATCLAVWVAEQRLPGALDAVALVPGRLRAQPWRLLTAPFAHAPGAWHVAVTMPALYLAGRRVELVVGRLWFILVHLCSSLAGGLAVVLGAQSPSSAHPLGVDWYTPVVGASGVVLGLLGALLVLTLRARDDARTLLMAVVAGLALPLVVDGVSWQLHLGGLLAGMLLGALAPRPGAARH